jgi:tRNA-specific 2-thiouridylase
MIEPNDKVLVAMSGGVDSSVAAYLLQQQGYDCTGATMRLFDNELIGEAVESSCCSLADVEDARGVCDRLGIPYYVFNYSDTFAEKVIEPFVRAYEHGATPNPCIACNRHLKFEHLLARALTNNYGSVATGHYARVRYDEPTDRYQLLKGLDTNKDQSYVLYGLTQAQLAHLKLPLGELTKAEVREFANSMGFINADKPESQDICFVPDGDYGSFIRRYRGTSYAPGNIVDSAGKVLGEHQGIIDYTIGQRKGLGVAVGHPLYVTRIDPNTNTVTIGPQEELYASTAIVRDINMVALPQLKGRVELTAKHRYRTPAHPAQVEQLSADTLQVDFLHPQKALTPGQALVLYNADQVIAGGTITEVS